MGVATSREVTLPADAVTQREAAALDAADAEQQRVAAEAFRKACVVRCGAVCSGAPSTVLTPPTRPLCCSEDALFREGYNRGNAEAVSKLDVDLAARAAHAVSLLSEESAREKLIADAAAQLRRSQYR